MVQDKKSYIDEDKVGDAIEEIKKIINKASLNIPELVLLCGNLCYYSGAGMAGYTAGESGPDLDLLQRLYHTDPTIDVALMISGLHVSSWPDDFIQNPKVSNLKPKK